MIKIIGLFLLCSELQLSIAIAANPIINGADPHAAYIDGSFWLYPTDGYSDGTKLFAYSSKDGVDWERHGPVLDFKNVDWIYTEGRTHCSAWAPCLIKKGGKFYLYYSVGPQSERHPSRIGAAVADNPTGPFKDSGKPLLAGGNGFEAIDPMVFTDPNSGKSYLYAGGSAGAKLRVFEMNEDMVSFAREIMVETPPQFTEGAFMHCRDGIYYLSYSHGGWRDSSYSVHYATGSTPVGPWVYRGAILTSSEKHKGPGHHSFVQIAGTDQWYIFYHRWNNQRGDGPYRGRRRVAAEKIGYGADGLIKPVVMTDEGIELNAAAESAGLEAFEVTSDKMLLDAKHIYNFSGSISVRPDVRQMGIGEFFSPPFMANPHNVTWKYNDKSIAVVDYVWDPAQTVLRGQLCDGVFIEHRVIPISGKRALICKLTVENRRTQGFKDAITLEIAGRIAKSDQWGWVPPAASSAMNAAVDSQAFVFTADQAELAAVFEPRPAAIDAAKTSVSFAIDLKPSTRQNYYAVLAFGKPKEAAQTARGALADAEGEIAASIRDCQRKIETLQNSLPQLITANANLQRFYQRSLLTFLTTRWDLPEAVFTPWYAEGGIDGGAMCNYLWGDAYISKFMTIADPAAVRALLLTSLKADYSTHYAINMLDGAGLGVGYSYDYYSMALLAYDYLTISGDMTLLNETVRGKQFLNALYDYVFEREDMSKPPALIDYGLNENLLELKKTFAYQHFTPSPNLERVLSCRMVDEMFGWTGQKAPADLYARAEAIGKLLIEQLWNDETQWFNSMDQDGKLQTCYSIQIFDILRTGVLSREQAQGLVRHLNENEFLSECGVHSLSKKDPGYDPSDIDWGGPGVYAGDAPELAADLMGAGFAREGIDVLERIYWWGELPYIPQALRADGRDYRRDGRANVLAALAGPQAIAWGLFGLKVDGDSLTINPVNHPYINGMAVENLHIRGHQFDVAVAADGKDYTVSIDSNNSRYLLGQPCTIGLKPLTIH